MLAGIYEIFCGNKNFYVGKQPDPFPGTSNTVCLIAYPLCMYEYVCEVSVNFAFGALFTVIM